MLKILRKLPYKLDRDAIKQQLDEAICALRQWLQSFEAEKDKEERVDIVNSHEDIDNENIKKRKHGVLEDGKNSYCDEEEHLSKYLNSQYGYENLKHAVSDIENCIDCVATIAMGAMEYY